MENELVNRSLPRSPTRSPVEIERSLEQLTRVMDTLFRIPGLGWRFGLNAIIDLVPGVGDTFTSLVALYLLVSAVRYRVPKVTLLRMALNVAIYYVIGLLPFVGDLFDAWWKPNKRNINLLRRHATVSPDEFHKARASDKLFVGGVTLILLALLLGSLGLTYLVLRYISQNI
jgi:hypothetical protein